MKLTKKVLAGLMALCLAGGVATTFALTYTAANKTATGNLDSAIYLNWGETDSVEDIDGLGPTTYVYRSVSVAAPVASAGVTGKQGQITFTLAASDDEHKIDGTTIYVSSTVNFATQTADFTSMEGVDKMNVNTTTKAYTFTTATTYYLAFIKDNSIKDTETDKEVGATLTMSLAVVDAA